MWETCNMARISGGTAAGSRILSSTKCLSSGSIRCRFERRILYLLACSVSQTTYRHISIGEYALQSHLSLCVFTVLW